MNPSSPQFPISHVKVKPQNERNVFNAGTEDEIDEASGRVKYNAFGKTDAWHREDAIDKESRAMYATEHARRTGKLPVQKFDDTK